MPAYDFVGFSYNAIASILALVGGVVVLVGLWWLINRKIDRLYGRGGWDSGGLDARRRIYGDRVMQTKAEKTLEALNDHELEQWIEGHPGDALAMEIWCERLREAGRLNEYAHNKEYFLTLPSALRIEEKCSQYHELARLYAGQLGRPEKASEVLRALIREFPDHYQATLARQSLLELDRAREEREN